MKQRSVVCALALLPALMAVPAPQSEAAPRAKRGATARKPVAVKTSVANLPLVKLTDPNENAFSISMPRGWRNQAYLVRTYELVRPVATSMSPDGNTVIFIGDPRLPHFYLPTPQVQQMADIVAMNPLTGISPLIPARDYFQGYVQEKFGQLPGFKITGIGANPALLRNLNAVAQKGPFNFKSDAVKITFSYRDKGKPMRAIINGNTSIFNDIWITGVSGVSSTGDPTPYNDLLLRVAATHKTNPQWQQQQQQLHEQRTAQLRQDHANMVASFNASNQAHQIRMNAIKDASNASMKSWYEKQAASDAMHRSFMNTITSEHTVVTSSGRAFQVDNSHQQYFVNKNNNTYVGTSSNTSLEDLRRMGLDPSNYERVKIKR